MPTQKMSLALDNFLKLVIACLVGLLAFMGKDVLASIEKLGTRVTAMELSIAEIKVEIKHLTAEKNAKP